MDHTGPLAWTVEDCALLLQAMAGYDAADPASANRPVPDFTADLDSGVKGLRIGVVRHFFESDHPVSDKTRLHIAHALDVFEHLGAEITEVTLSPLAEWNACGWVILTSEAYAVHEPWLKTRFNDYGELLRDRLALGGLIRAGDYVQALRRRRMLCLELQQAMTEARHPGLSGAAGRGTADRRGAEMGDAGAAVLHHPVQPDRLAGDERVHRLRRRWPAGGDADSSANRSPRRRCSARPRRTRRQRPGVASGRRWHCRWRRNTDHVLLPLPLRA